MPFLPPSSVVLQPSDSSRNTIQPTGDAVVGTVWKWHSATHSAIAWELRDNTGTLYASLSPTGGFTTGGLTLSYDNNAGAALINAGPHLLRISSSNLISLESLITITARAAGTYLLFRDSGTPSSLLYMPSTGDPTFTIEAGAAGQSALRLQGAASQTYPLLELNQISSTSVTRNTGKIDGLWATSTDATRHGQLVFYSSDNGGDRESIRIGLATGTAAAIGFLGAAAVVRSSAYTQTYATTTRTHSNVTSSAVGTTASTQTVPWGYASQAQADAIPVAINAVAADLLNLKQLVNSVIDDHQLNGLFG